MSDYLIVRPIRNPQELAAVRTAVAADPAGHLPLFPTHVAMLHGEIVGSISCLSTPFVCAWSNSERMTARNTRELFNTAMNLGRSLNQGRPFLTTCAETSPIYPFMPHFGFKKLGATTLFLLEDK